MLTRPLPDLVRDILVAMAPGASHLVLAWLILG
jgi:hypothetical protein